MIVTNASEQVAKWAQYHLRCEFVPPYVAWGILDRKGRLSAAIVFNDFADKNIEVTLYGRNSLQRGVLNEVWDYCFGQLGCERITSRTRSDNSKVIAIIEKVGFVKEGVLRRWYGDVDAVIFGMLKHEFKYRRHNHGGS